MEQLERLDKALKIAFQNRGIYAKKDMADYLGYKNPYFSGVINGKEKLSDGFLNKISEKLGINPDWVTNGAGNMFSESALPQMDAEQLKSEIMKFKNITSPKDVGMILDIWLRFMENQRQYNEIMEEMVKLYKQIKGE